MSFNTHEMNLAIAQHGTVYRIVIVAIRGSSPREVGASMLLWPGGQSGSIGGGALEFQATQALEIGLRKYPRCPPSDIDRIIDDQVNNKITTTATIIWTWEKLEQYHKEVILKKKKKTNTTSTDSTSSSSLPLLCPSKDELQILLDES